eukprot:jgi/Psemu1/13358/gm1.13358_g
MGIDTSSNLLLQLLGIGLSDLVIYRRNSNNGCNSNNNPTTSCSSQEVYIESLASYWNGRSKRGKAAATAALKQTISACYDLGEWCILAPVTALFRSRGLLYPWHPNCAVTATLASAFDLQSLCCSDLGDCIFFCSGVRTATEQATTSTSSHFGPNSLNIIHQLVDTFQSDFCFALPPLPNHKFFLPIPPIAAPLSALPFWSHKPLCLQTQTTKAINTARSTYLKTLDLPNNASVHNIVVLQTSPKIRFSYINTHGTIQATHSLVPWSDPAGAPHLAGAHTDSIQVEALVSFPSVAFDTFVISVAPKNTVPLFCTWTDTTLLSDDFASSTNPTSHAGSAPLDHNGSAGSIPQFLLAPLLWPTTWDIPVDHPIENPLPDGSYDNGFTTCWLPLPFSPTLHTQHSLFGANNWTDPGPDHTPILSQLSHETVGLSTTMTRLQPMIPNPGCRATWCLPFINDTTHLTRRCAISLSPPDTVPALQEPAQMHTSSATTTRIRNLANAPQPPAPDPCICDTPSRSPRSWSIFLACEHSDDVTGKYTIHPATPSLAAKALFLDKPAIGQQTAAFNNKINPVAKVCHTSNILPFVNITRRHLSIFNFLCILHSNNKFCQRIGSARLYETEALNIDKATCRTCNSATTLFINGL